MNFITEFLRSNLLVAVVIRIDINAFDACSLVDYSWQTSAPPLVLIGVLTSWKLPWLLVPRMISPHARGRNYLYDFDLYELS
jgi:hypothetical protein